MKLEQFSSDAGRAVRDSVRLVDPPSIAIVHRSRALRTTVATIVGVAAFVGTVAFWPGNGGIQSTGPAGNPTTSTTTTTALEPSTGSPQTRIEPTVAELPIAEAVPLRILAIRPNNPSLAVLDLEAGTTTVYPPGAHTLPLDATDGAVMTPTRNIVIWTNGEAQLFPGSLDEAGIELGPTQVRLLRGYAPSLRVVPTPDGTRAWVVQPGIGQTTPPQATIIELVELATGKAILTYEADANAFPVAATTTGLVLNTEQLIDTGDGWVVAPGSERVLHLLQDGTMVEAGAGRAVAAGPDTIIRFTCPSSDPKCDLWVSNELTLSTPGGSTERIITAPSAGAWIAVGGPSIPSDSMPLQTVSPDGSTLLIGRGQRFDVNNVPGESQLVAVDLVDGTQTIVAEFGGPTPVGTWSADGKWIALVSGRDIRLINMSDATKNFTLPDAIPANHFLFAAG